MEGYSMPLPDLGHPRINARLQLPEASRSLATSFIGSWCLGIPTHTLCSLTISLTRDTLDAIFSIVHTHCQRASCRQSNRNTRHQPRANARARFAAAGFAEIGSFALGRTFEQPVKRSIPMLRKASGEWGTRTPDPLLAKQVLYQLS